MRLTSCDVRGSNQRISKPFPPFDDAYSFPEWISEGGSNAVSMASSALPPELSSLLTHLPFVGGEGGSTLAGMTSKPLYGSSSSSSGSAPPRRAPSSRSSPASGKQPDGREITAEKELTAAQVQITALRQRNTSLEAEVNRGAHPPSLPSTQANLHPFNFSSMLPPAIHVQLISSYHCPTGSRTSEPSRPDGGGQCRAGPPAC